jgi:DNA polymerase-3 subunit gamma/tau
MAGEAVESGVEPHMLLRDLAGVCHRVSRAKVAGATRDVSEAEDYSRQIEDLAGKVSLGHISLAWQVLLQAHKETLSAPDPRAALDMGLIKLLHAVSLPDPGRLMAMASGETASAVQAGGQGATGAPPDAAPVSERAPIGAELEPAMEASAGEAPRATTNAAPLHDQQDLTPILHAIEESRNLQLLEDVKAYVRPVRVTRGHVEFAPAENAPSDLANRMREALNAATGETWMVSISRSDAAGPTPAEQAKAREEAARAQALAHPTVQAILDAFDGAELVLGREATTSKTSDEARDDSHGAVEETPRPSTAQGGTP